MRVSGAPDARMPRLRRFAASRIRAWQLTTGMPAWLMPECGMPDRAVDADQIDVQKITFEANRFPRRFLQQGGSGRHRGPVTGTRRK
jgi:hypothetical protein